MSAKYRVMFIMLTVALLVFTLGCPKKVEPPPEPEAPPVVEDTVKVVEPPTPPPPEVKPITDEDFHTAYFDFDKYNLRPDARAALEFDANILKENPDVTVLIEGHCDERGTVEYNLALGEKRANAARDYLKSLGIDASRMETISYGKEKPVALGHDEKAWQLNRFAKLIVTSQ